MSVIEKTQEIAQVEELLVDNYDLVLYNDDVNTFDHVINQLVKYCDHNVIQAEQCAYIVHYNGKCQVKHGEFEQLKPICEALLEKGLTAKIQ
ncbi:MAG: ATP-dependent Clp protease adaptor ClpS [Flavobacteriales bacterium]|nr:ATP-dependent Clp protease adaptor ClpS [Flavobacteriales bacterium]MCB9197699.1 ATP-dependent Clp protease adaptor ClpS [Flavobacteriales bacterium]